MNTTFLLTRRVQQIPLALQCIVSGLLFSDATHGGQSHWAKRWEIAGYICEIYSGVASVMSDANQQPVEIDPAGILAVRMATQYVLSRYVKAQRKEKEPFSLKRLVVAFLWFYFTLKNWSLLIWLVQSKWEAFSHPLVLNVLTWNAHTTSICHYRELGLQWRADMQRHPLMSGKWSP